MVSTVTDYRSPVRLVKHAFEEAETYSPQAINRARKKLMAEIALSGDEIVIDDISYSRNDASTLLDAVTEESWKAHSVVYAHTGLLDFLEKQEFNDEALKKADAYLYNAAFVQAVSPYFTHSFNAVSGRLLKSGDFEELAKLQNYASYILPEHSSEAYQKVSTYLDDLSYTVRNLSWEKFSADESILHFIFSKSWKAFFNRLPSSFTSRRDEVVEHLINIVLNFQHKATWYYLHRVLVQLKLVETNDFNRSEVERIDKIIHHNSTLEGGPTKKIIRGTGGGFSARAIWWGIWIILLIIRAATCNDRNKNSNLTFNPGDFHRIQKSSSASRSEKKNAPVLLEFFDSLSRQPALPLYRLPTPLRTGGQPFTSFADPFAQDGLYAVTFNNNSGHDCVALYLDGASKNGSVYAGALPHVSAVFIRKGGDFTAKLWTGTARIHFLFGDNWGKLRQQAELIITGETNATYPDGRKHTVPVYEFFGTKEPLAQPYLQRALLLDEATDSSTQKPGYIYLSRGNTTAASTDIELTGSGGAFVVKASGQLAVKETTADLQSAAADTARRKILEALRRAGAKVKDE